jgi:hypothetical protein
MSQFASDMLRRFVAAAVLGAAIWFAPANLAGPSIGFELWGVPWQLRHAVLAVVVLYALFCVVSLLLEWADEEEAGARAVSLAAATVEDGSNGALDMPQRGELKMVDLQKRSPKGQPRVSRAKAVLGALGLFLVGIWVVSGETGAYDSLIAGHGVILSALSWPSGFAPVLRLVLGAAISLAGALGVVANLLFGARAREWPGASGK